MIRSWRIVIIMPRASARDRRMAEELRSTGKKFRDRAGLIFAVAAELEDQISDVREKKQLLRSRIEGGLPVLKERVCQSAAGDRIASYVSALEELDQQEVRLTRRAEEINRRIEIALLGMEEKEARCLVREFAWKGAKWLKSGHVSEEAEAAGLHFLKLWAEEPCTMERAIRWDKLRRMILEQNGNLKQELPRLTGKSYALTVKTLRLLRLIPSLRSLMIRTRASLFCGCELAALDPDAQLRAYGELQKDPSLVYSRQAIIDLCAAMRVRGKA